MLTTLPPIFKDVQFPLDGEFIKITLSHHSVQKNFQDTTLTDCDLGKEEIGFAFYEVN